MDVRVVRSEAYPGDVNMALDVILAREAGSCGRPVIRFYRWNEPTISVGRSVAPAQAFGAAICYPSCQLVRRPTGGGVVQHSDQMSFALAWPRGWVEALRNLRESYFAIHRAVQQGLVDCGYPTTQVAESDLDGGILCSTHRVAGDLVADTGGKVVGGAQWRLAGAVLYEGHLWVRWMPMLEDAIAFRLAALLNCHAVEIPLSPDELELGRSTAETWAIRRD